VVYPLAEKPRLYFSISSVKSRSVGGGVARVVIVGKREHADFALQDVAAGFHPSPADRACGPRSWCPSFRQLLDGLAIAQPTDVREIGGNGVALGEPLARSRHPGMVNQCQRDVVFPQKIVKRRAQPGFVADFQGKSRFRGKLLQKWLQPRQKIRRRGESLLVEVWNWNRIGPRFSPR